MHEKSLTELRAALAAKECSAVELAQLYLKRIDAPMGSPTPRLVCWMELSGG